MVNRTRFVFSSGSLVVATALLAGCSLLPETAPAEVLSIQNAQAMRTTNGSEEQEQELLQQRLALVTVQSSEAFKSISASERNLQTPVTELVAPSVGTLSPVGVRCLPDVLSAADGPVVRRLHPRMHDHVLGS